MSLKLKIDSGAVAVPVNALLHICDNVQNANIKFLCLLLSHGGAYRPFSDVKAELIASGIVSEKDSEIACAYLQGAGILTEGTEENTSAPVSAPKARQKALVPTEKNEALMTGNDSDSLTSDSIKEWMEGDKGRREFVKACEDVYGNVFNKTELMTVITYSSEYRLRDECILAILGYSRENGYGITYTKKIFNRMVDNNINTLDSVNAELAFLSEHSSYVTTVKNIFGFSRALTTGEKPKVERWHKEYKFSREMIQLAFDKAAASASDKATIAYCDKILTGWHKEGLLTADAVQSKLNADRQKNSGSKIEQTYSLNDFFNAAVARSYSDDKKQD